MKLEYRYGQVYYTDLHVGDMLPTADGNYIILTEKDIDEKGCLKQNQLIYTNSISEKEK